MVPSLHRRPPAPRRVHGLADPDRRADQRVARGRGAVVDDPDRGSGVARSVPCRPDDPSAWHSLPGPSASDRPRHDEPASRRSPHGLDGTDQHRQPVTVPARHDVGTPMDSVAEVHVQPTRRTEHHGVAHASGPRTSDSPGHRRCTPRSRRSDRRHGAAAIDDQQLAEQLRQRRPVHSRANHAAVSGSAFSARGAPGRWRASPGTSPPARAEPPARRHRVSCAS